MRNTAYAAFYRHLGFAVLACGLAGCATTPKTNPFAFTDISSPQFFPVFPWNGPTVSDDSAKDEVSGLKSIADCNFNIAGFVAPKDVPRCEKLGLGAIVQMNHTTPPRDWSQLSDVEIDKLVHDTVKASGLGPAVTGYFIRDEPTLKDFPALAKAVAAVKKYAPGKYAYINLFPDYATAGGADSQLGTSNYTDYLEKFVSMVHPQALSYDNYNVQYTGDHPVDYYQNLVTFRKVAQEHDLPCLNIVGSCQITPEAAPPSPADLMLQTYTTLAAGYRGVTWFTYYRGGFFIAPIDEKGRRTPEWAWLSQVNHEVLTLAPILSTAKSTGVYFSSPAPASGLPMLPGKLISSVTSATPIMVGEFSRKDGGDFAMVVNLSIQKTTQVKFTTSQPYSKVLAFSAETLSRKPIKPQDGYWLIPGQGVLLQLMK